MARSTRTRWLKAVALVVALASLTINYGLIDLIDGYTGYIDQARNQVLDAGRGLVFGAEIPLGLLAQLRRPERRIAGIQQVAVVALALGMAGVAERHGGTLPSRRELPVWVRCWSLSIRRERRSSRGAAPGRRHARARGRRRRSLPRLRLADGLGATARSSACRCGVERAAPLVGDDRTRAARAAARAAGRCSHDGLAHPGISASIAAGGWAISCLLAPDSPAGSEGHPWGWAVLVWAVVTFTATLWPRTRDRAVHASALAPSA